MKTIDDYRQYFSAEYTFIGTERHGADVWLTAENGSGIIRYEIGITFFSHLDDHDFAISYDARVLKELFHAKELRSKKRDEQHLELIRTTADELDYIKSFSYLLTAFEDVQKIIRCSTRCGKCHQKIMNLFSEIMKGSR